MAATLIQETELIEVASLSMLVYGPPGGWKTSLAQTADRPLTLDFDRGAHRAFNRKAVLRFDAWKDVSEATAFIPQYQTVVVDTIGRLLDLLSIDIMDANPKHGTRAGGLSLQGFGALKARFAQWIGQLRLAGKDLVMIAHEKEEKDGDDRYMRPDVQGGSYTEVMKFTDLVGYLNVDRQGRRLLDFNPSDRHLGKNAAGWKALAVPDLREEPSFLLDLFASAKKVIGSTSEASAALARVVDEWTAWLDGDPSLDQLNESLPKLSALTNGTKKQVWHLLQERTAKSGLVFDKAAKKFVVKEGAAA